MITVQRLTKRFGGLVAVNGVDMSVSPGEIFGIVGPNGSGKTTVINLLSGDLRPDYGRITFAGKDVTRAQPFRMSRLGMSRTFQLVRIMGGMTVRENVLTARCFGAAPVPVAAVGDDVDQLLDFVGLTEHADKQAVQLTYIDRKRLEFARALATRPKLLLLDEYLAGLNPSELHEGVELIQRTKQFGITIIFVEHVMSAVRRLCDRVMVMSAGIRIAEGKPDEVLADETVIRAYLGDDDA